MIESVNKKKVVSNWVSLYCCIKIYFLLGACHFDVRT